MKYEGAEMSKIIRTPTKATGGITKAEQEQMKGITDKWIAIAMRTNAIEPAKIIPAIQQLYAVAGLKQPKVVIVSSPRMMAFAGGFAAAIWWLRKNPETTLATAQATDHATDHATAQATAQATDHATHQATYLATYQATLQAVAQATAQATDQATTLATRQATRQATDQATRHATAQATDHATAQATDHATRQAVAQATAQAVYQATDQATRQAVAQATAQAVYQATDQATDHATAQATTLAVAQATHQATYLATAQATDHATRQAVAQATDHATAQATDHATRQAVAQATAQAVYQATDQATLKPIVRFMFECAARWHNMYQGGNTWASWACYLAAFRDVIGLQLPAHEKYMAWEQCAMHGGFRIMHEEFCMVSDFPEIICVDEEKRPHCEDGPSHRWRDGWELYYWHGVQVSEQVIRAPHTLSITDVRNEDNAEVRRIMIERMGWERFCSQAKMRVIHRDSLIANFPALPVSETVHADLRMVTSYRQGEEIAELLESEEFQDFDERPLKFVRVTDPSTGENYLIRVWPENTRVYEAVAQTFAMTEAQYKQSVLQHS